MQKARLPHLWLSQQKDMRLYNSYHSNWRWRQVSCLRNPFHVYNSCCTSSTFIWRRLLRLYGWDALPRRRYGFSGCLSIMALAWAVLNNSGSMYIAQKHAIQVPFQLRTRRKRVNWKALLDSGATKCFIHPCAIKQLKLTTWTLAKARKVQNVDGTSNKAGQILEAVDLTVNNNGEQALHAFYVTDIGQDDFILGYPFLEASNPDVDWRNSCIDGFTTISTAKANSWRPILKGTRQVETTPVWVWSIPGWEEGDEVWLQTKIAKTTVASQLAQDATDKKKCTWQEIVPEQYHHHGKVFSEEALEWFPAHRPWDHAIELKEDAPTSINWESTPYLPRKRKNNANSYLKIYAYKEFVILNPPMPVDSSLFERKMASFVQFKTIKIWTNGQFPTNIPCR